MRIRGLITLVLASLGAATPARAADPARGTVSPAAAQAAWSGSVTGVSMAPGMVYGQTGGTHGACVAPACDTFGLTVSGNDGAPLVVEVAMRSGGANMNLEVVGPDGNASFDGVAISIPSCRRGG